MKESNAELWSCHARGAVIAVTTGGLINPDGTCAMPRGSARQAKERFARLDWILGQQIAAYGNHVFDLGRRVVSFPVESSPFELPDPELIARSCQELVELTDYKGWTQVVLPRPGCGSGGLEWATVRPILARYLDDRFEVVSLPGDGVHTRPTARKGAAMATAKPGDRVTVSYIGTLDDGRMFANTNEEGPLEVTLGADEVFPALEAKILGMREGEVKNVTLAAAEAYGPRRDENILRLPRDRFPADRELCIGGKLQLDFADGAARLVRIVAVDGDQVVLDANHALAGCDLTFALRLDKIEPPAAER